VENQNRGFKPAIEVTFVTADEKEHVETLELGDIRLGRS
jgi:hypothetical protein